MCAWLGTGQGELPITSYRTNVPDEGGTCVSRPVTAHPSASPLTALTPESCWPIIMTTIEMSCHRKPLKVQRVSTDICPSSFSDWSSRHISSISSSTSSQPLSLCRANWERKVSYGPQKAPLLPSTAAQHKPWAAAAVLPVRDSNKQRKKQESHAPATHQ